MGPRTERRAGQWTFLSLETILLETMFISAEIASHYMQGRHGKGSIFVFAAGNGGVIGDSCAFSGYVNSIYTIAISGVNWDGSVPAYTEQCAGIMAVTYGQDMFADGKVKPPMVRSQYRPVFITRKALLRSLFATDCVAKRVWLSVYFQIFCSQNLLYLTATIAFLCQILKALGLRATV